MQTTVKRWQLVVLMALTVAVVAVGTALATIPDSNGVIHGCRKVANPNKGYLRVIDTGASQTCPSGWTPLDWSQIGPPGAAGAGVVAPTYGHVNNGVGTTVTCSANCNGLASATGAWPSLPLSDQNPQQTSILVTVASSSLLDIRFSAISSCGAYAQTKCYLRLSVDGSPISMNSYTSGAAFDTSAGNDCNGCINRPLGESHAMEHIVPVGAGTHTIELQWQVKSLEVVSGGSVDFSLDDATLVVQPYPAT